MSENTHRNAQGTHTRTVCWKHIGKSGSFVYQVVFKFCKIKFELVNGGASRSIDELAILSKEFVEGYVLRSISGFCTTICNKSCHTFVFSEWSLGSLFLAEAVWCKIATSLLLFPLKLTQNSEPQNSSKRWFNAIFNYYCEMSNSGYRLFVQSLTSKQNESESERVKKKNWDKILHKT